MSSTIQFRPAREADLEPMYDVFYQNEIREEENPPASGAVPPYLPHVLRSGKLVVAEQDGKILGYTGAITRDNITYLTDLFVRPDVQSGRIGQRLLELAMPQDGLVHCTASSTDMRALSLYIRVGMQPQWPLFTLRLEKPARALQGGNAEIEVSEADPADPELAGWDTRVSGRSRFVDQQFWVDEQRGEPVWFRRGGRVIGYGYIRPGAGSLWYPQACTLGPIGVEQAEDATACVLAAVDQALQQADVVRLFVPGPHPSLALLIEKGFRIVYTDTFALAAEKPFFDEKRYIPSGDELL